MELLGGVSLFQDLTRDQLRLLAFGAEHRHLRAGEILFRAEARADAGFIVVEGEVNLVDGEGDARRIVGSAGPGSLLGEMALMADTRRPVTAVTAADCDFIRISRPLFKRMLQEYPDIAATLHRRIAGELQDMAARIVALSDVFDYDDEADGTGPSVGTDGRQDAEPRD